MTPKIISERFWMLGKKILDNLEYEKNMYEITKNNKKNEVIIS